MSLPVGNINDFSDYVLAVLKNSAWEPYHDPGLEVRSVMLDQLHLVVRICLHRISSGARTAGAVGHHGPTPSPPG